MRLLLSVCRQRRPDAGLPAHRHRRGPSDDEFFDLNGGTGKKSATRTRAASRSTASGSGFNAASVSHCAYEDAERESWDDEAEAWDLAAAKEAPPRQRHSRRRRGARCVGECGDGNGDGVMGATDGSCGSGKRSRLSKKNTMSGRMMANLLSEAEQVLTKLINYDRSISFKQKRTDDRIERKRPPPDPRMCDERFVFAASVRKYVKTCLITGTPPSLDALHNLSLMAKHVSARAQAEAQASDVDALRTAKFRKACASLIVCLWAAVCSTPYMQVAKRGTDAFRPFVCGCIYGFKRGVTLSDGSVLVPTCPQLASALPALRGTGGNQLAKTLHSSSHRGLCTLRLHVVPAADQATVFESVVRNGSSLPRRPSRPPTSRDPACVQY